MRVEDVTILIGENSVLARKQLKDALISLGAKHILEASDGQEVIDLYREHTPGLVFVSLLMPGKDGNAAISEIKADDPDADIVVVSSMGTQSQLKQMLQLGVTDFIQKPFENEQIEAILNTRLEGEHNMYAQFFGNYLLSKRVVTPEQLIQAIEEQHIRHIKVGLLAINAGLMTVEQVDKILLRQTEENKQFGELAVEEGFLTEEQLRSLLQQQIPVYLLIGERLVENGFITESKLEELIASYKAENTFNHLDTIEAQQENLQALTRSLFMLTTMQIPDRVYQYLTLLFHNLVRFIGEDFLPLNPSLCTEYVTTHCSGQIINGEFSLASYLDMEEETAVSFASRFADARFKEYDEYVHASIGDFLNWQNGLFNVNMSNEESIELFLNPVVNMENTMISSSSNMILLPIAYPFGTINFIFKI